MQLNHLYRTPQELPAEILLKRVEAKFYLPTEIVIRTAGFQIPDEVRCYNTGRYLSEGKIMEPRTLYERHQRKSPRGNYSLSAYRELILVECFVDRGDDGHTDYGMQGWALTTEHANFFGPVGGDPLQSEDRYFDWVYNLLD
jgi:hypothetical protein